jgi:molybdopterin-guanine dinucleotide biosynthesis protein A
LKRSAIILAGGSSSRLGRDKALVRLAGKPLILHVFEKVVDLVDEVVVVVSSSEQKKPIKSLFSRDYVKFAVDDGLSQSPLVGASAGFKNTSGEYALLLPCDTPFLSAGIILLLMELCVNIDATIPRWPNDHIEPLQAVYRTQAALAASKKALDEGRMDMRSMIGILRRVRYVSTIVLREIDPRLKTFFNVNTPVDLMMAERMLEKTG